MSFFSPRNIWLVIMVAAIGVSMYVREEHKTADIEAMRSRQIGMMVKMLSSQAVVISKMPPNVTDSVKKQIREQIDVISSQIPEREVFPVQRFLLLTEIGDRPAFPEMGRKDLLDDLRQIYVENKSLADSKLFSVEGGELARIKSASNKDEAEAKRLREELEKKAAVIEMVLGAAGVAGLAIFAAGLAVTYWFFRKIPPVRFFPQLISIDTERQRLMLESAVLYVFLVFPVGAAFGRQVAPLFGNTTLFALVHLTTAFFACIGYYSWNGGSASLRLLIVGDAHDPWKEAAFGILGFAAIFPPAIFALLFTLGSAAQDSVRIAHPIAFEIQRNPVLVFVLAAVLVPVFEEVVFRCFLYGFFRREQRIRFAAFFSASVFAVLHPQGVLALPYLTILGIGLAILREYRPSPIASMTAHACVNGTAVVLGYVFTAMT